MTVGCLRFKIKVNILGSRHITSRYTDYGSRVFLVRLCVELNQEFNESALARSGLSNE